MPGPLSSMNNEIVPSSMTAAVSRMKPLSTNLRALRPRFNTICFRRSRSDTMIRLGGHTSSISTSPPLLYSMASTGLNTSCIMSTGAQSMFSCLLLARCMSSILRSKSLINCNAESIMLRSSFTIPRVSTNGFVSSLTADMTKLQADMAAARGFLTSWAMKSFNSRSLRAAFCAFSTTDAAISASADVLSWSYFACFLSME
mmetsp:Transcript_17206/g.28581  ORF Transcript_17206/g.28581 Transcript_17206/m.28581 type:complete len:201 (-) Transcript_17206:1272-1874(-)